MVIPKCKTLIGLEMKAECGKQKAESRKLNAFYKSNDTYTVANRIVAAQVSDTTGDASSNAADLIKSIEYLDFSI